MKCNIEQICPKCNGEGIYKRSNPTAGGDFIDPCPTCNGKKVLIVGQVDLTKIVTKLNTILAKCECKYSGQ